MPRLLVSADDGRVTLDERVECCHLESDHYRRYLCERLLWAVQDATGASPPGGDAGRSPVGTTCTGVAAGDLAVAA